MHMRLLTHEVEDCGGILMTT